MFYETIKLRQLRENLWDKFMRRIICHVKGMKEIREIYRDKLFYDAKYFMATCPYDKIVITLERSLKDDRFYHMNTYAPKDFNPEENDKLFEKLFDDISK